MTAMEKSREYRFTRRDFEFLRRLATARTGIVVTDEKSDMFYSRLVRRVRALGLPTFAAYCEYLEQPAHEAEIAEFVNALTTNLTSFFREAHHFRYLSETALPELVQRNDATRRLRIWSAGCSSGEEPYSIAMTLAEQSVLLRDWDVEVLASDIDSGMLTHAEAGIYALNRIENLPEDRLRAHFQKGKSARLGAVRVREHVRRYVRFMYINLMDIPSLERQDIIFCRNVIIYFDKKTKRELLDRFAESLADDGYLFVGHSESLSQITDRFKFVGQTIYQKVR